MISRRAGLISFKCPKLLGSLIRLRGPSSLQGRDPRVVGVFGVANLACEAACGARAGLNYIIMARHQKSLEANRSYAELADSLQVFTR
jgi:hypothetical protein